MSIKCSPYSHASAVVTVIPISFSCFYHHFLCVYPTSFPHFIFTRLSFLHHLTSPCFIIASILSCALLLIFISLHCHCSGEHSLTVHFVCPLYLPIAQHYLVLRNTTAQQVLHNTFKYLSASFRVPFVTFLFLPAPRPYLLPFFDLSTFPTSESSLRAIGFLL